MSDDFLEEYKRELGVCDDSPCLNCGVLSKNHVWNDCGEFSPGACPAVSKATSTIMAGVIRELAPGARTLAEALRINRANLEKRYQDGFSDGTRRERGAERGAFVAWAKMGSTFAAAVMRGDHRQEAEHE